MNIKDFPLAWRWVDISHAVLSPDALAKLTVLEAHEADRFYSLGQAIFHQKSTPTITHSVLQAPGTTRSWLRALKIRAAVRVVVVWNNQDAISMPWHTFVTYWDDFCYPSSDDVFIFFTEGASALSWSHYEVFEFIETAI